MAKSILDKDITIFWFRRDLRLKDNAGLYHALSENKSVVGIFIFDTIILDKLSDRFDRRVEFIHQSLQLLKIELERLGSSLLILHGDPTKIFNELDVRAVYTNHDYEPYAIARDNIVASTLAKQGIDFKTFKDHVIFERDEVVKDDGKPYTIFTPYSKKWKSKLNASYIKSYPTDAHFKAFARIDPLPFPSLSDIGFEKTGAVFPERSISQSVIMRYDKQRDFPAIPGTTKLSVHLRFGTVSIRELVQIALVKNEVWLNELIWREFYHMILWHFPQVDKAFKPAYDRIEWRNNPDEFKAWCDGKTGYPIVDAGMRELNATGFMHNRVRMITASFLVKHLLIDWRWGEAYFAEKLLDFDVAANNGGWQWAAGSGCDAAPYFRVFNPQLQTEKFDPEKKYIRKWVPEFESMDYTKPIVEHKMARERVLRAYKEALSENN
ncbi:MAG TPA: deoxyribodipyrimidine photo-lyase [Cyclobacteriaceae bacterium]|nr:deoxyribodipyrimidine photo-lyase [Cyclobacteriaceae bacterium]